MTQTQRPDLVVIGGASLDVIHLPGRTVNTIGGAALHTALAARCAGAQVVLYAPLPDPMPHSLAPVAERVAWSGPLIAPDDLPRLEIAQHGKGRATLLDAAWGAVARLEPDALPPDLFGASMVHVAALPQADHQIRFVQACRARGAARLSAGTYARLISHEPERVRALFDGVDAFFMNENEANLLWGGADSARTRPGQLLFVTLGERGARVVDEDQITSVPGVPAAEVDPTGAGDTFCGAILAELARGAATVSAARTGVALAAEVIGAIGPARLVASLPGRSG